MATPYTAQQVTLTSDQAQAPNPPYNGSMDQVSSGPAGILYTLSNDLIAIYNEVEELYNEMTIAEVNVQKNTIKAGADAQRTTATNQMLGYIAQGVGSLASAGITAGTTIMEGKGMKEDNAILSKQQGELNSLKNLNGIERIPNQAVGPGGDRPDLSLRAKNMMNGDKYEFPDDAGDQAPTVEAQNKNAIGEFSDTEYATYKTNLAEKISAQEKAINTTQLRINSRTTSTQMTSQMYTAGAQTLTQGAQATTAYYSGKYEAVKQVTSGVTQMASSTADNTRSQIGQFYSKVDQTIANARQGAQTYAQT